MISPLLPQDQVFWYLQDHNPQPLRQDITTDVLVVGGGMAGLTAAQAFAQRGLSVVLVEKTYCGAGASGKSSGFITPDAELHLSYFVRHYGADEAKRIWNFIENGVSHIRATINNYSISCDYQQEDTLIVSNSKRAFSSLQEEHKDRLTLGYESTLYSQNQMTEVLGSTSYFGGIRYGKTFGIQAYLYCQELKKNLQQQGIHIYEETPAISINKWGVQTPYGSVKARYTIVCIDRFLRDLHLLKYEVYHAQTFLTMSIPLTQEQHTAIFPQQNLMVWDTDLIYTYYRMAGNNRFMIGGGSVLNTYSSREDYHATRIIKMFQKYMQKRFNLELEFEYCWPGLIGISKDIVPLAGTLDHENVYYIAGAAGLPIAAALGLYSANQLLDGNKDFDHYFSLHRKFFIGKTLQRIIGTKAAFALSNGVSEFFG